MQSTAEDTAPRYFNPVLLAITLVSLIPMLVLATSQYVEYDGYMHVWIAQQDRWSNFFREYQADAHPPLYYLLLRLSLLLGHTQLVYRLISLIPGAASVFVLGRTAFRILRSPVWAGLSALAYGIAMPTIVTANEVRAYMISAFLVQVSFYYFLDLIGEQPASLRPRILFGVTASLACLNEYYAIFYIGGVMLLAFAIPVFRRGAHLLRDLLREAATFALVLAVPVAEFLSHIGGRPPAYSHLPDFYFQPDSGESVAAFLLRNLRNELNGFSPWRVPEGTAFYTALAILIAATCAAIFLVRRPNRPKNLAALVSLLLPVLILFVLMAGSLARAYPFGGFLRQQFILFPLALNCIFLLPDRLLAGSSRIAMALAAVVGIGVIVLSVRNYQALPKQSALLMSDEIGRYHRLFPNPEAIYIDQFNVTTFFMHYHDWAWKYVGLLPGSTKIDVYRLSQGNRSMLLFRDWDHWNFDLRDPELYKMMSTGMRHWHLSSITIFELVQEPGKTRTGAQVTAYLARIDGNSAAEGLCKQTLELNNYDVYAEFRTAGLCKQ